MGPTHLSWPNNNDIFCSIPVITDHLGKYCSINCPAFCTLAHQMQLSQTLPRLCLGYLCKVNLLTFVKGDLLSTNTHVLITVSNINNTIWISS